MLGKKSTQGKQSLTLNNIECELHIKDTNRAEKGTHKDKSGPQVERDEQEIQIWMRSCMETIKRKLEWAQI